MILERIEAGPLSVAMRDGSRAVHIAAENSAFMGELAAGRVNALGYRDYLLRFRDVYAHLERLGRELADHPAVAAVLDPALDRLPAIEADLAFWSAADAPAPASLSSAATAGYLARLDATPQWPPLLVAHHYTRYLGDLSGGRILGRVLKREFGLDGHGVSFYDFPAIPKPKRYKDDYRARLDALDLTPDDKQRLVEEVRVAFALNQAIFTELAANLENYRR